MKRLFFYFVMAGVIQHWLTDANAYAGPIYWSGSESLLGPNLGTSGSANIYSQNFGSEASISLSPGFPLSGFTTNGVNSATLVLAYVYASDVTFSSAPALFGGSSGNYSLSVVLHDDASGASGSLTFYGNLSGMIYPSELAGFPSLTNTIFGSTSQSLKLGQNLYTVTIGYFTPPGNPPQPDGVSGPPGSILASISVQPLTSSTPEPSTLLLACLGLPSLGLTGWFRRRKAGKVGRILETHAASLA